jgi:hypothetical protein
MCRRSQAHGSQTQKSACAGAVRRMAVRLREAHVPAQSGAWRSDSEKRMCGRSQTHGSQTQRSACAGAVRRMAVRLRKAHVRGQSGAWQSDSEKRMCGGSQDAWQSDSEKRMCRRSQAQSGQSEDSLDLAVISYPSAIMVRRIRSAALASARGL